MNPKNTRNVRRTVFAGMLETVTLLKRGDDQRQGVVRAIKLFQCRRSMIHKTGETLQGDMLVSHRCVWHIPRQELKRVGVAYLNPLDRIIQTRPLVAVETGWYWQPEATTMIDEKLFNNEIDLHCVRIDPPLPPGD